MYVVGLLGGIASGKSLVSGLLARRGAWIIDADRIGHQVLKIPEVKAQIRDRWSDTVFDTDGEVDRSALATIVFGPSPKSEQERKVLEQITHPAIGEGIRAELERAASEGAPIAVLDAPVMLEAGWDKECNTLVYIDVPRDVRRQRALESRGWKEEDFTAREGAQKSLEKKRSQADFVIDNSTCIDAVEQQVDRLWAIWMSDG
ncbi:MAG: dephospho-CoA kinase [Planctomycetia bacterium]|jgi:dephospho-CoA kinase